MARKLDSTIAAVLKEHGFGADACWDCHGTWVVYHRVLEQIAAKAGITYAPPQVLVADRDAAAILVVGTRGDHSEWSIGEAVVGLNYKVSGNQAGYPFAMAEKRAKDRVILKLIGLTGLAYSEEEADDFKRKDAEEPRNKSTRDPDWMDGPCKTRDELRKMASAFVTDLNACNDLDMLAGLERSYEGFLKQLQHNSPTWWDSETDPPGMKQRIEKMHRHLAAEDARRTLAA